MAAGEQTYVSVCLGAKDEIPTPTCVLTRTDDDDDAGKRYVLVYLSYQTVIFTRAETHTFRPVPLSDNPG